MEVIHGWGPFGGKKRREYKITLKLGMEMNIYLE